MFHICFGPADFVPVCRVRRQEKHFNFTYLCSPDDDIFCLIFRLKWNHPKVRQMAVHWDMILMKIICKMVNWTPHKTLQENAFVFLLEHLAICTYH